jgi:hypothetical protein
MSCATCRLSFGAAVPDMAPAVADRRVVLAGGRLVTDVCQHAVRETPGP